MVSEKLQAIIDQLGLELIWTNRPDPLRLVHISKQTLLLAIEYENGRILAETMTVISMLSTYGSTSGKAMLVTQLAEMLSRLKARSQELTSIHKTLKEADV